MKKPPFAEIPLAALSLLLLAAAPACSGEILVSGAAASSSGSATAAASGTGGSGGGGTGGGGGAGGAQSCDETHDSMSVSLATWEGTTYDCSANFGDYDFSARFVDHPMDGLFLFDSCSPAADCTPRISKLTLTLTDSSFYSEIAAGAYVRVRLSIAPLKIGGCREQLQITNLPTWDGVPNPIVPGERLWFLGVDGGVQGFDDSPVVAAKETLACSPAASPGCVAEDYAFRFRMAASPDDPGVLVPMGKVGFLLPDGGKTYGNLEIRNLRSYLSGDCVAAPNLAYWVKYHFPGD